MSMTSWTLNRAAALFERSRLQYWPRRLRGYHVELRAILEIAHADGFCQSSERLIVIDIARHRSDRAVRGTLFHEMVTRLPARKDGHMALRSSSSSSIS